MRLGDPGDPLGIVKEREIRLYEQMVYVQTRICSGKWDGDFEIQTDHLISTRRSDLVIVNKKAK